VHSVRLLQGLLGTVVVGATALATVVAIEDHAWLVLLGYLGGTILAMASTWLSYRDMLRSEGVAHEKLAEQGLDDERLVWISSALFSEVVKAAERGELERQTFERLIRRALAADRSTRRERGG
jgi:hypothetical protein